MCNRIFEYGILRFECVTRFEYSNQIRMCYEIRTFQPDSNIIRDSNTPTRFECITRFEQFEYSNINMRSKSFDRQKSITTFSTFPSLVLTNGAHADVAIEILKVLFEVSTKKKVVFIFLIYLMKIVHFFY